MNWLWSIIDRLAVTDYRSRNCNQFPTLPMDIWGVFYLDKEVEHTVHKKLIILLYRQTHHRHVHHILHQTPHRLFRGEHCHVLRRKHRGTEEKTRTGYPPLPPDPPQTRHRLFRGEHRHILRRKHRGTEEKNKNWLSSSTARPTTDTFTTYSIRHRTVSSGENTAMSSDANTEELKRKTRTGYPPLPPDPPQTRSPHTPSDTAPSLPGRTPPCPPTQTPRNWGEKQELVILLYRQTHHRHIQHILHQTPHRLFRGEHCHVLRRKHRGTEEKNKNWLSSSTARPTTDTFTTYSIRHRTVSSGENTTVTSDANTEELKRKTRTGYHPLPPDPPQTRSPHTPSDTAPSLPGRTPPCPPTQTPRNWREKQELVILLYRQTHHRHIHQLLHQTPHRLFRGEHRHVLRRKHRGTDEKNKNWLSSSTARPTTDTFTNFSIRHRTVSSGENTAMSSDANTEELRRKTRTGYPPLPPDPPETRSPHTPSDTAPSLPGRTPPCPPTQTPRNWREKQELVILLYRQTHHRHIHQLLHQTPHRLFRGEHRHVLRRKHRGTEEKNKNWLSSSTARPTTDTFTTYSIRHRTASSGENTAMSSDANTEELRRKTRTGYPPLPPDPPETRSPRTPSDTAPSLPGRTPPCPPTQTLRNWRENKNWLSSSTARPTTDTFNTYSIRHRTVSSRENTAMSSDANTEELKRKTRTGYPPLPPDPPQTHSPHTPSDTAPSLPGRTPPCPPTQTPRNWREKQELVILLYRQTHHRHIHHVLHQTPHRLFRGEHRHVLRRKHWGTEEKNKNWLPSSTTRPTTDTFTTYSIRHRNVSSGENTAMSSDANTEELRRKTRTGYPPLPPDPPQTHSPHTPSDTAPPLPGRTPPCPPTQTPRNWREKQELVILLYRQTHHRHVHHILHQTPHRLFRGEHPHVLRRKHRGTEEKNKNWLSSSTARPTTDTFTTYSIWHRTVSSGENTAMSSDANTEELRRKTRTGYPPLPPDPPQTRSPHTPSDTALSLPGRTPPCPPTQTLRNWREKQELVILLYRQTHHRHVHHILNQTPHRLFRGEHRHVLRRKHWGTEEKNKNWLSSSTARPTTDTFTTYSIRHRTVSSGENTPMSSDANTEELRRKTRTGYPPLPPDPPQTRSPHTPSDTAPSLPGRTPPCPPTQTPRNWGEKQELVILLYRQTHHRHIHHILHQTPHRLFRGEHRHILRRKHRGTEEKNKNWLSSSTARPTTDTFTTYSIRHRTVSSGENTAMSSDANTEELKRKTRTGYPPLPPDPPQTHSPHTPSDTAPSLPGRTPPCPLTQTPRNWGEKQELVILLYRQTHHRHVHHILHQTPHRLFQGEHRHVLRRKHWGTEEKNKNWLSSSTARPTTDTFTTYSIRHRTVSSGENTAMSSDANTEELKRKTRTGYPPLPPDPPQTRSPHTPSDTAPSLPGRTPPCPPTQTLRNWREKQELVILPYCQTHHRHIHHVLHQTPHRLFRGEHRHVLRRKHTGTEEKNKNRIHETSH